MLRRVVHISVFLVLCSIFSSGNAAHVRSQHVKKPTCGYESCPTVDPEKLNIHLIPHTHDDVGWLKTVDQYYFGSRTRIQKAGVQYILDAVVEALRNHSDRRFIYVETSYLWKWWQQQDENIREEVRSFINDGRLEIIGGGWSMNDEAVTHYHSLIDQYTWGFRWLNDTFGECARPRIGWQIDPFGHSREQASIFSQMGYDGMFFGRLDYQDKSKRLNNKTAEFVWEGSSSLGSTANLFSVALYNNYGPPPGFCFDVLCDDEPMIDDPDSPDNNIDARIRSFKEFTDKQARYYRTNNIILTMGGDFTYQHAQMWYKNLDKLIRYTNEKHGSEVNVFYSTPSCYLKSLNNLNMSWPTKSDDFFPYASDPHSFWTGYFSSRPTLKYYERLGNNFLQIVKQLSVLSNLGSKNVNLDHFREAMGIMQHHDAVTGTEKQHVAEDYARILYKSMEQGAIIASEALGKWMIKDKKTDPKDLPVFQTCMLLNISTCEHSEENKNFVVTLYNPLSRVASPYVRIPVGGKVYTVKDFTGSEVITQLVPIPEPLQKIVGRISKATSELVFRAPLIPALGYQSFYVSEKLGVDEESRIDEVAPVSSIGGELYNITVNADGKVVVEWNNQKNMRVEQSFKYYESAEGNNEVFENRSSGAYIFRPKSISAREMSYTGTHKLYKGPLVEEIHQSINEWVSQVIRVYNGEERIEFNWLVGPIPTDKDKIGKEIITSYSSNLASDEVFFTDSNAREMLKRKKNYRPTWDLKLEEPIAGNYYPVTNKIYLKDEQKALKLSVLTDRAQGGSSLRDGELELMVHRRLLKDDAFGVGEALNETAYGEGLIARGQHYLIGSNLKDSDRSALNEKTSILELALRPWILITPTNNISYEEWSSKYNMQGDSLAKKLPPNVHILTLEPWKGNSILLRLEHIFETNESTSLAQPVDINIQDLFISFPIWSVRETTLGGNQWLENSKRLKWNSETNNVHLYSTNRLNTPLNVTDNGINVHLNPMEIRTFIIDLNLMSNTVMPGEEVAWAQTFVTVTPHDDGFLREIEENVVISGPGDTPLHLDTWNIVLRRSLMNTTKDWIDPTELEQSRRVGAECQTYLQGVPKVELPLVYRDEATQTLYMGRDGLRAVTPLEYFDDIITVLNEKTLPELKTSRVVQTIITMKGGASENDVITMLSETKEEIIINDSQLSIEMSEKKDIFMEVSDILNFIVDRTLWMTNSQLESLPKREKKDADVQTFIKYNHSTKKLTIDYEVQTKLTCKPEYSNSMLLNDYNETKNFCRTRVNECIEKGVYPRIAIDNIVDEIMTKCKSQIDFPFQENFETTIEKVPSNKKIDQDEEQYSSIRNKCPCRIGTKVDTRTQITRDKSLDENRNCNMRKPALQRIDPKQSCMRRIENRIVAASESSSRSESSEYTSSSSSSQQNSSSERSFTSRDEEALCILKNAFCNRDT